MNRRSFFKKAATGAAVLAIAPKVLSEPFMPNWADKWAVADEVFQSPVTDPNIAGWVSYKFHMTVSAPPDRSQRIRYIA